MGKTSGSLAVRFSPQINGSLPHLRDGYFEGFMGTVR